MLPAGVIVCRLGVELLHTMNDDVTWCVMMSQLLGLEQEAWLPGAVQGKWKDDVMEYNKKLSNNEAAFSDFNGPTFSCVAAEPRRSDSLRDAN